MRCSSTENTARAVFFGSVTASGGPAAAGHRHRQFLPPRGRGAVVWCCAPLPAVPNPAIAGSRTALSYVTDFLGAGEGNRTLVVSLGSFCSAIELHPPTA